MPPVTAKARAKVQLRATTSLDAASTLAIVKQSTSQVKGGGKSLLTTGVVNVGAAIHVESESPERLGLSMNSGKRLVELCTFSAAVAGSDGATSLRVGVSTPTGRRRARCSGSSRAVPR